MQQIADWLKKVGLGQYAQRFADNDIDTSILCDLTDTELEKIGVSLGHRRKLLRAIADLKDIEKGASVAAAADAPFGPHPPDTAERRQVTVMFCDLVGSTALSARLDPEDLRGVIGAYHRCCTELVERDGGFIARYMGDGVLAYFGYPQAHEHDAERAVRAGLALIEAVPKLVTAAGSPLQVRVGIATGLVVIVGDLIGLGEAQERGVVGETLNLASRLQAIAEPNTAIIADSTRRLLGNLFELVDLGPRDLKGIVGPARAWAAQRASSVASRFEALHATDLTALVGREEETQLLLRRWSRAKIGEGQVVLLSGEAGIGKSRLTAALLERLATEPHTRLRYFCSPLHTDSALYPIIRQMERAAGLARDDKPQVKLDKLEAALAQTSTSPQDAALFAEMLSLQNDGRYPALDVTAQQRRQRTLEALTAQLAGLASRQPVLMIFEDVHWIDPTSLEALGRAVDRIKTLRVLLLVTFRPEFNAPWVGQSHVTSLTLNRLGEREAAAIIAHLVGNQGLQADLTAEIVQRTDGIPLFVEEMTKAVLEAESEGAALRTVTAVPSAVLAVPASLYASLMARLDRLGGAKEVAQIGAAIGREFSHALLASVVLEPEAELGSALDRLIAAGLLFRQGVPPQATYLFKHALVQDAAYETLLRASRVHLHARIASAIETGFPQLAEAEPESLARHHIEAGNMGRGLDCLLVAGRKALEQSAFAEAKTLLRSAIELVATALDVPEIQSRELEAQILLGNVLMATVGYGADEVGSVYKRAHSLTLRLGNRERELPVLYGLWAHGYSRLELIRCLELATQLLEVAREIGNRVAEMTARRLSAFTLLPLGRIKDALVDCEVAMTLYQPEQDRHLAFEYAQDPYVALSMVKVWCLTTLGATDRALQVAIDSVALARQLKHNHTLAYALGWALSRAYMWRRDAEGAMASAEECITISREHGFPVLLAAALIVRAWALAAIGDGERAAEAINEAWSAYESAGALLQRPMVCAILAEAQIHLGCLDIADSYLDDGLSASQASAHIWYTPELYRLKAQVARQRGAIPHDETKAWLRKANELAEILEAPLWQLRAARDLFEQQVEAGDFISAREMLLAIHARFTEGFDTLDLKEAKALLDELAL